MSEYTAEGPVCTGLPFFLKVYVALATALAVNCIDEPEQISTGKTLLVKLAVKLGTTLIIA